MSINIGQILKYFNTLDNIFIYIIAELDKCTLDLQEMKTYFRQLINAGIDINSTSAFSNSNGNYCYIKYSPNSPTNSKIMQKYYLNLLKNLDLQVLQLLFNLGFVINPSHLVWILYDVDIYKYSVYSQEHIAFVIEHLIGSVNLDVEYNGATPLKWLIKNGYNEIAKELIENGVTVSRFTSKLDPYDSALKLAKKQKIPDESLINLINVKTFSEKFEKNKLKLKTKKYKIEIETDL